MQFPPREGGCAWLEAGAGEQRGVWTVSHEGSCRGVNRNPKGGLQEVSSSSRTQPGPESCTNGNEAPSWVLARGVLPLRRTEFWPRGNVRRFVWRTSREVESHGGATHLCVESGIQKIIFFKEDSFKMLISNN